MYDHIHALNISSPANNLYVPIRCKAAEWTQKPAWTCGLREKALPYPRIELPLSKTHPFIAPTKPWPFIWIRHKVRFSWCEGDENKINHSLPQMLKSYRNPHLFFSGLAVRRLISISPASLLFVILLYLVEIALSLEVGRANRHCRSRCRNMYRPSVAILLLFQYHCFLNKYSLLPL